ncbi:MAG: pyruvate/2-oxoglutarate/acetoin dehydrogenase E1 component [Myxococcota bacterium]
MNAYQAIHGLLSRALADRNVHILGEALELSPTTRGLMAQAPSRVHLLPAADASLVGVGVGLALSGARPVISLSGPDALWGVLQQLGQEAAPLRAAGDFIAPIVLRVPLAPGEIVPVAMLCAIEGIIVASPATPEDAVSMVQAALDADRPVVLLEPRDVLSARMDSEPEQRPLTEARIVQPGEHASILAWGAAVRVAREAAAVLEAEGIFAEVIDLRAITPLDVETVAESVSRTGRPVVVGGPEETLLAAVRAAFLRLESPPAHALGNTEALTEAVRRAVHY